MKKTGGAPTTYTTELADEIVAWLSEGKPLREYCRQDGKPGKSTVGDWRKAHADFDLRFLQARDDGYDAIAADCLRIADTVEMGVETVKKPDGSVETRRGDMLGHRKLKIDTRLKLLSKWDPRRYGDRLQLANDPDMPFVQQMDATALDARIAELMAKGQGKD